MYKKKDEFVAHLEYAMNNEPEPLSQEHSYMLTWEAATERFIEASTITKRDARRRIRLRQPEMDERALDALRGPILHPFQKYTLDSIDVVPKVLKFNEAKIKDDDDVSRHKSTAVLVE